MVLSFCILCVFMSITFIKLCLKIVLTDTYFNHYEACRVPLQNIAAVNII